MYPLIWGKTIHEDLIIWLSSQPIKYLEPLSLCLNLSDGTVWFVSIKFKAVTFLEVWNSFSLTWTSQNLMSFHSFWYCTKK